MGRGEVKEHWLSDLFFLGAESGWRSHGQPPLIGRFLVLAYTRDLRDSEAENVD